MNTFGKQLRYWRKAKGFSQLELATEANVSSKHISFLETGRSLASREMVLLLGGTLDISLRRRNELLTAAGFAESFTRMPIHQKEMQEIKHALDLMLDKHDPYPAIVIDWDWNVLQKNQGYEILSHAIRSQCPVFPDTNNIVELIFDPDGFKPFIRNWEQVASITVQRLHRERLEHRGRHETLLERLFKYPDTPKHWQTLNFGTKHVPMVYIEMEIDDTALTFFTTLSSFGTPIDITAEEIMIEQYFPADDVTRYFFENKISGIPTLTSSRY